MPSSPGPGFTFLPTPLSPLTLPPSPNPNPMRRAGSPVNFTAQHAPPRPELSPQRRSGSASPDVACRGTVPPRFCQRPDFGAPWSPFFCCPRPRRRPHAAGGGDAFHFSWRAAGCALIAGYHFRTHSVCSCARRGRTFPRCIPGRRGGGPRQFTGQPSPCAARGRSGCATPPLALEPTPSSCPCTPTPCSRGKTAIFIRARHSAP